MKVSIKNFFALNPRKKVLKKFSVFPEHLQKQPPEVFYKKICS